MGTRFVYISDVSELTDESRAFLLERNPIDTLMIDALYYEDRRHGTHMNLQKVLEEVRQLRPRRTVLTGMSHDFDYDRHNQVLAQYQQSEGIAIEMAFDGMTIAL